MGHLVECMIANHVQPVILSSPDNGGWRWFRARGPGHVGEGDTSGDGKEGVVTVDRWKRDFAILWSGEAVSVLTSSVLQMALIWNLTASTKSALVLSMASLAAFLPNAVIGVFAGTVVDRVNRKAIMIGADLFIAAVSLTVVLAALEGELAVGFVLVVLAVRSIGTAFHAPAINAVTPLIVPAESLTRCAGYTQSLQTVGYIAGTAIAGVLYPIWSISGMVALDVAGAVIASLAVLAIRIPEIEGPTDKHETGGFWRELAAGYQVLRMQRGLFAIVWISAAFMVFYSPINALFPLMSLDYFGGTTIQASIAEITFSVGMLVGGVLLGVTGGMRDRGRAIPCSIALMGIPIFVSGTLPGSGFWVFACLCTVMGLSVPFYNGPVTALLQERIAPEYLGRVFGLYASICSFAMPVGLVISGAFADNVGVARWFMITGLAIVAIAVVCLAIPSVRGIEMAVGRQPGESMDS